MCIIPQNDLCVVPCPCKIMIKTSGAQESDCYSGKLLDGSFSDDYATIPVHAGDTLPLFF